MTNSVEVDNVSKRFVLNRQRPTDLREALAYRFRRRPAGDTDFWALDDVSFALEPGASLGIVGHNGSGKSTMLKLLTGIMKPTRGTVRVKGRVAALIEVGAGFHPDLTGRENVYLNGSILGLSRREIARKFDAIVDFAGLEKFIDTPVKRYSTGMFMRLGFSIAAHIDPDVLLVDEVLAVGDTLFQRKCLRRMKEFIAQGGTVVFVSHAMVQVAELCRQCVWLDHGRLLYQGDTKEAVGRYMDLISEREEEEFKRTHPEEWAILEAERREAEEEARRREEEERRLTEEAIKREQEAAKQQEEEWLSDPKRSRILGVTLVDADGKPRDRFRVGEPLRVQIAYRFARRLSNPAFCFEIYRDDGAHMFTTSNFEHGVTLGHIPLHGRVAFDVPFLTLNTGSYRVRLRLFSDWKEQDWDSCLEYVLEDAHRFTVLPGRYPYGIAYLPIQWVAEPSRQAVLTAAGEP